MLSKSQTQPDGGEGYSDMATGYPAMVPGEEAALPQQGIANARGDVQEPSLGGFGGTSLQHKAKSSIHLRPKAYTRRSCAERYVFTPGDLPRVHKD